MGRGFAYVGNEKDHWLTPPDLLAQLGEFELDPCAFHAQPWRTAAVQYALPEEDGLLLPWRGRVWCNPPYGPELLKWTQRMALHRNGILLAYARTETEAFRGIWKFADAILFLLRRVQFRKPDGTPADNGGTSASVLAAWGGANIDTLLRMNGRYSGILLRDWDRSHA